MSVHQIELTAKVDGKPNEPLSKVSGYALKAILNVLTGQVATAGVFQCGLPGEEQTDIGILVLKNMDDFHLLTQVLDAIYSDHGEDIVLKLAGLLKELLSTDPDKQDPRMN